MLEKVREIESEISALKNQLGTADNKGEISWIIDRLENQKGSMLKVLRAKGEI